MLDMLHGNGSLGAIYHFMFEPNCGDLGISAQFGCDNIITTDDDRPLKCKFEHTANDLPEN